MEPYNGYKPVEVFGVLMRIRGNRVYHHAARDEYSIEHDYERLVLANGHEVAGIKRMLAMEKAELDAADQRDDAGKNIGRKTDLW